MDANRKVSRSRRRGPRVGPAPVGTGGDAAHGGVTHGRPPQGSAALPSHGSRDTAISIRDAFRARIGDERHDVWFGGAARVEVERTADGELVVTLAAGNSLTHGVIKRTFRAELLAAVREALGESAVRIEVVPDATGGDGGDGGPSAARDTAPAPDERTPEPGRQLARVAGPVAAPVPVVADGADGGVAEAPARGGRPQRPFLTLEGYVVGPGNRMAHAAAAMAAERPGAMSPLFLHGPSGVGKTHLVEGILVRFRRIRPRAATVMLSAEQFTTTFLETLHGRRGLPGFRRSLRSADLLVIDGVQFLAGKKATVSEFLHTLDTLHREGKQVVVTADRDIEGLADLGDDLQARLRGGMSARILPPDEATRDGIVAALAARRGFALPDDVRRFVASRMTRNAREIAGAVNRLEATSHMLGIPVDLAMAEECLADLVRSSTRAVRLADVERAVCSAFGVDPGSLQSPCRAHRVNHPRILAMFLARKHTDAALVEIGRHFGRRSHSTVISAQRTVDGWIAAGTTLRLAGAEWGVDEALRRVEEALRVG